MHCTACDKLLTDYEATRKEAHTFNFIDLCKTCFEDVKPFVSVVDRKDLITEADLDNEDDDPYTGDSLELGEHYIDYVVDSKGDYDV